ncbi:MAG: (2Fe-2S)-binding protein [Chitinophagaceae bacterium]|nr:(2Fe-2S)-binding protein [Chitinophagaceae bacterium]
MASFQLSVNNKSFSVEAEPDMPLLWVLRDMLDLTGTKFGCGVSACGACTVLINDHAMRSCQVSVKAAAGQTITTIEGLSEDGTHPVQKAWEKVAVPQCGYCQTGQMMTVVGLLKQNKRPTEEEIDAVMSQNLCRCGTYHRIKEAVHQVIEEINK